MNYILIVEDDIALSNGIVLALKEPNNLFTQTYDIATAKEQLNVTAFDLMILDINLPDGSGLDLLTHIRKKTTIPIIVLTANDMETDDVTGFELGADDYITKPFSLMVLRARVGVQLKKSRYSLADSTQLDNFSFSFERMEFLKSYTETTEPVMNYTSKFTSMNEFSGMQNTIMMIGGTLSLIIGLIGILNFVNAILTSILTRRQEFAMLQSIGMTKKQLRGMLIYEGLYYVLGTALFSILLGIIFSISIVEPLSSMMWFLSYHFINWPLLASLPLLLLLGILIPVAVYSMNDKQSIVERLRQAE